MDFVQRFVDRVTRLAGRLTLAANKQEPSSISQAPLPQRADNTFTSQEIVRIALILRQILPGDLVPFILDHARLWATVASSRSLHTDRVGQRQAPKLQTALIVPPNLPRGSIRRIRFIIDSSDQGWSSYPEDHGTYRGSWTWFEAGVRGLDPTNEDDIATLHAPIDCQHRNALDGEHRRYCLARVENYKYGAKKIVTNLHAGREFKKHVVEWEVDSEDEDVRSMLKELCGGHRIEVAACALYPGWCNNVKSVVIEIECAVVRKM